MSVVVHQQHRHLGLHIPVLECIVEHNQLKLRESLKKLTDSFPAVLTHRHLRPHPVFLINLVGLVAEHLRRALGIGKDKPVCLPLIATAQDSYVHIHRQTAYDIFHVRGLAGAAYSDVSYANHRYVKLLLLEHSQVEGLVSDPCRGTIQPRHRRERICQYLVFGGVHFTYVPVPFHQYG